MENKILYGHKCTRCGKEWWSKNEHPVTCRWCKTPYWNKERVNKQRKPIDTRVNGAIEHNGSTLPQYKVIGDKNNEQ